MRCIEFGIPMHSLVLQINPTGEVSRICFSICDILIDYRKKHYKSPDYRCSGPECCSAESLTEPFLGSDMFTRFDQLCKSLCNTLVEVELAILHRHPYTQEDLAKPMRIFRDQMPSMKERGCLSFRILQLCDAEEIKGEGKPGILQNALGGNDQRWNKLVLDD